MHSVFRIGQVKQIDKNNRLWQVNLILTSDNDPQLQALSKSLQEETKAATGWYRLGKLMLKIDQFNKTEELYEILLKQTSSEHEKARLFHHVGYVKIAQEKYAEAIVFYEKALEIQQNTLPANHPHLATSYSNIGLVYDSMGEYPKALEIFQKPLPENRPDLAASYSNIGTAYCGMGKYPEALSYYERALKIFQSSLPPNHPSIKTVTKSIEIVRKK